MKPSLPPSIVYVKVSNKKQIATCSQLSFHFKKGKAANCFQSSEKLNFGGERAISMVSGAKLKPLTVALW